MSETQMTKIYKKQGEVIRERSRKKNQTKHGSLKVPDMIVPSADELQCGGLVNCYQSPEDYFYSQVPFTGSDVCGFLHLDSWTCDSRTWNSMFSSYASYPLSWFLRDIGITNIDAVGVRVLDVSGWLPIIGGFDIDIDALYFIQSHEFAVFASPGPQVGEGGGFGITRGLLFGSNMPSSNSYKGGSYKMVGGDASLLWWGISMELDHSIGSINQDGSIPSTTYIGVGPINIEAGAYTGASWTVRLIHFQLP